MSCARPPWGSCIEKMSGVGKKYEEENKMATDRGSNKSGLTGAKK
jgi:hypothetical protein